MKATILLDYDTNTRQVEEEEKSRFVRAILEQCFDGNPVLDKLTNIWSSSDSDLMQAPQKVELRKVMSMYGIQVIDDKDGNLKIFLENERVAEWYKCTYKLKKDYSVIDPKKRFFLEMLVNCWSVFEEAEQNKETEEQLENNQES